MSVLSIILTYLGIVRYLNVVSLYYANRLACYCLETKDNAICNPHVHSSVCSAKVTFSVFASDMYYVPMYVFQKGLSGHRDNHTNLYMIC